MTRMSAAVAVLTAILFFPKGSQAVPIYDFSTESGGAVTSLGSSFTLDGGIIGSAWYLTGGVWTTSTLIARDETNDHGLGVCSEGDGDCNIDGTGGGDWNELSQLEFDEAILLEKPADTTWTGLWLSSLDGNDSSTDIENGTLYWGSSDLTGSSLILALLGGNSFNFAYGDAPFIGSTVEGQLVLPGTFDPNATYVLFVPGGGVGDNNDYLVWGADLEDNPPGDLAPVPEPASLLLVGTGVLALAHKRRRTGRR